MRGSRLLGLALFAALAGIEAGAATGPAPSGTVVVQVSGLRFTGVPPGRYAIALLDDANRNGKADKALFLPREGFGFSRNAAVRFGPPKFAAAAFDVGAGEVSVPIRMRYMF